LEADIWTVTVMGRLAKARTVVVATEDGSADVVIASDGPGEPIAPSTIAVAPLPVVSTGVQLDPGNTVLKSSEKSTLLVVGEPELGAVAGLELSPQAGIRRAAAVRSSAVVPYLMLFPFLSVTSMSRRKRMCYGTRG